MTTGQKVAVVVPKMEQSPLIKTSELKNIKATTMNDSNFASAPTAVAEDDAEPVIDPDLLQSELELVSSLAKLQKLEETVCFLLSQTNLLRLFGNYKLINETDSSTSDAASGTASRAAGASCQLPACFNLAPEALRAAGTGGAC